MKREKRFFMDPSGQSFYYYPSLPANMSLNVSFLRLWVNYFWRLMILGHIDNLFRYHQNFADPSLKRISDFRFTHGYLNYGKIQWKPIKYTYSYSCNTLSHLRFCDYIRFWYDPKKYWYFHFYSSLFVLETKNCHQISWETSIVF